MCACNAHAMQWQGHKPVAYSAALSRTADAADHLRPASWPGLAKPRTKLNDQLDHRQHPCCTLVGANLRSAGDDEDIVISNRWQLHSRYISTARTAQSCTRSPDQHSAQARPRTDPWTIRREAAFPPPAAIDRSDLWAEGSASVQQPYSSPS